MLTVSRSSISGPAEHPSVHQVASHALSCFLPKAVKLEIDVNVIQLSQNTTVGGAKDPKDPFPTNAILLDNLSVYSSAQLSVTITGTIVHIFLSYILYSA